MLLRLRINKTKSAILTAYDKAVRIQDRVVYGECFGHSLGHGFGLMIHEAPYASTLSEWTLEPGMTITVEPGIYIEGRLGVRIEDCCVVTETGKINLVSSTKELLSVD